MFSSSTDLKMTVIAVASALALVLKIVVGVSAPKKTLAGPPVTAGLATYGIEHEKSVPAAGYASLVLSLIHI